MRVAACERVGDARLVWHEESDLSGIDAVVVPGGFSYGDYLRAGAIARFAPAMEAVARFAADGGPVLGICNGFQVLCEAGLLPGRAPAERGAALPLPPGRAGGRPGDSAWTAGHRGGGAALDSRQAHERPVLRPGSDQLDRLEANGQVVLRYAPGNNPNGSLRDIAGVANEQGNVMGLMPHPEHAVDPLTGSTDGLRLFAAVAGGVATAA